MTENVGKMRSVLCDKAGHALMKAKQLERGAATLPHVSQQRAEIEYLVAELRAYERWIDGYLEAAEKEPLREFEHIHRCYAQCIEYERQHGIRDVMLEYPEYN